MRLPAAALSVLVAVSGWAQTAAPQDSGAQLAPDELNRLCTRAIQLMEAGGVAVPALARAAAPFIDEARASCLRLQSQPAAAEPTYALLLGLRAYASLSDAAPKPYPFPAVARDQGAELRDAIARLDAHFRALLEAKEAALRAPDRDGVSYYREQNRLLPPPDPKGRRVVFLGDSITSLWRLHEYFPQEDFINRAIEGQITGQLLGRMKADVVDLRPVAVVIQGGTFDLTRNIPLTAIEDNYVAMADIATANNIKPVFASVLPVSDYYESANPEYKRTATRPPAYIRALNDWIKSLCAQRGYTYIDFYSVLADESGALSREASDDGLLPNAMGYRLMAPVLARGIEEATRPARPAPASPSKPATRRR
jgi:lysophospholipase L1-like esterase